MPGPMVEATTQDLIYWPLAAAGFALTIASIKASRFCWSFSGPKLALPMGQWMMFGLVQAVFDLTGLGFGNSLRHVGGHGTSLGRGHQATGAQDFTQTANHAHHIRGSNDHVEIHPAFALDLLHIFVASGEVCASSQSSVYVVALAESQNPNGFTGAVRQNPRRREPAGQRDESQRPDGRGALRFRRTLP